jgi:hypothetical protein
VSRGRLEGQQREEEAGLAPMLLGLGRTAYWEWLGVPRVWIKKGQRLGGYLSGTVSMDHNRECIIGHIPDSHTILIKL